MSRLDDVAPRLGRAWAAHLAIEREVAVRERHRTDAILSAARLLAHRELQSIRAGATRSGRYVAARDAKLQAARRAMRRAERPVDREDVARELGL